ncbi:hypothetical protein C2845_PM09G20830 [Panicum miliaceum]|uniref:SKP1 component POZ domain-containing protein n=1 Tax=Panicum miliaceum TaxID=4540 RepID=A0A3L6S1Q3_PANMI|nr:hypothetical protein C2845_PM09G20830 [Panicum miliaceum]
MMMTVTIISSDNVRFEMSEAAASLSRTLRRAIENGPAAGGGITPLMSKVPSKVLAKVIEYCSKHAAAAASETGGGAAASSGEASSGELRRGVARRRGQVHGVRPPAGRLLPRGLGAGGPHLPEGRRHVQTAEDIRKMLHIKDDSTPEEEANRWFVLRRVELNPEE